MNLLSIRTKILSAITVLIIGMVLFVTIYISNVQKANMINEMKTQMTLTTDTLVTSLKNMMLVGEAPFVVDNMRELANIPEFIEIAVYRTNGVLAFSDDKTLKFVNSFQKKYHFQETPRLTDERTATESQRIYKNIQWVLENNDKYDLLNKEQDIEYFQRINNEKRCQACHGEDHSIRGVVHVKLSVQSIFSQIAHIRNLVIIALGITALLMIVFLYILLRFLIIAPMASLSQVVKAVSAGDFGARSTLKSRDEMGQLAGQLNQMIKGLEERFHLSKYVSRTTVDLVKARDATTSEGIKKQITVLFSDIRGFTAYSENQQPETIIGNLNRILQTQARQIEHHGGDIDKFIGDEIMAVFDDPYQALLCAYEMIRSVLAVDKTIKSGLRVGIGINSGEVIAGNIGTENRHEYAVIGDTVNVASRLCALAKPSTILISQSTYNQCENLVKAELVPNQKIKGKKEVMNFFLVRSIFKKKQSPQA